MTDDTISRQAAVSAVRKAKDRSEAHRMLIQLSPAQPGQRNARVFQGIIVEYPSISAYPEYEGKPYFSIKYTENGQEFIGYGTYKPEVLSEYLKEYFMPPAQPGWATDVNDILAYLDGVVHPLVSPENWNVYSELHDMVSGLLKPWKEGQNDG